MEELLEILDNIKKNQFITLKDLKELDRLYNKRFWKGLALATKNNVKKYIFKPSNRELWIITSENRDYYTLHNFFCNCKDFYLKVVLRRESRSCKHLLAKFISIALNNYETIEIDDDRYNSLITEWREFESS
ncbi:MAG: hypothetical protein ACTSPY_03465 [Candidatus Helarchaeota archaeon]